MARAALQGRLNWQVATVLDVVGETARCTNLVLDPPAWAGHRAGQHVDVRLTAEDGYQAQRSYSIASGPEDPNLVLTIERLDDGEVSPYLVDELRPGDELELRGPIGGYFVWEQSSGGPLLLVAGGSGVVPFRAMLRHSAWVGDAPAVRLLYSARSIDEVLYRQEFLSLASQAHIDVRIGLTRAWPEDWQGHRGRFTPELLRDVAWPAEERPLIYVCGPSGFVEAIAGQLVDAGHDPSRIRTERFGPTGS
jgi:ferredoxin-NADP reductase